MNIFNFLTFKKTSMPILKVSSSGIENGIIKPEYGSASENKLGPMPLTSIPIRWTNCPKKTKTIAITIVDNDTVPIIGFPWIHWVVANISPSLTLLPRNASINQKEILCQGVNSFANGYTLDLKELKGFQVPRSKAYCYGGFVPVNFPHLYTITVYALDISLTFKDGYTYNELTNAMINHILGYGVLHGIYNAKITKL